MTHIQETFSREKLDELVVSKGPSMAMDKNNLSNIHACKENFYIYKDLSISHGEIESLLKEYDLETTARNLGHDVENYDNIQLAGRLLVMANDNCTPKDIKTYVEAFNDLLFDDIKSFFELYQEEIDKLLEETIYVNFIYDWISANVLYKTYLAKSEKEKDGIIYKESPQFLHLRLAAHMYQPDFKKVIETYKEFSEQYYFHATPTNINGGTKRSQCSSCFLITIEDNLQSITGTGVHKCAQISKYSGGLGIDVSRIRHSEIKHSGMSQGLVPMLVMYNFAIRYVNQGGRRKGAATIYTRPHHIDIIDFVEVNSLTGDPYSRAHDLDLAVWTSWLFWKRVVEDGDWSLFCPALTKELNDIWGIEFMRKYEEIEKSSVPRKTIKARKLFEIICRHQQAGNKLFTLNGDSANFKSNQKNLGYIRCSNLCTEIIEYTDSQEMAACNLAQISLSRIVEGGKINYRLLGEMTRKLCHNLNRIIDRNWYPYKKISNSNLRHRPMGIGVSGFAEMLHLLDLPFEDPQVHIINKRIFACMYYNSLLASIDESIKDGPYETFFTSPAAEGKLQFDLWAEEYLLLEKEGIPHNRRPEDDIPISPSEFGQEEFVLSNGDKVEPTWEDLKKHIKVNGLRNSLFLALMPTATSSTVLRNCESVEAHQTNIYGRKLSSGSYPIVNRFLWKDLSALGLWNTHTVHLIQADDGSIAQLEKLIKAYPEFYPNFNGNWERLRHVQKKYKTMWELPQVIFLKLAAERGRYICQSQSTNLYFRYPRIIDLQKAQLYAAKAGLKTLLYYVRQEPASDPLKITLDTRILQFVGRKEKKNIVCTDEVCLSCQ